MDGGHLPSPGNVETCFFVLQKIANSLPIGRHQKRSLRFKFAIVFGNRTRWGSSQRSPDLLSGSRKRAPKGRGGIREGDEGKGGEGNVYAFPWKKILRAPMANTRRTTIIALFYSLSL